LVQDFQESLARSLQEPEDEKDQFFGRSPLIWMTYMCLTALVGMSLREMVHEFKHQILVLFKCLLLQPKVWFMVY
jgi:hypothetical protein